MTISNFNTFWILDEPGISLVSNKTQKEYREPELKFLVIPILKCVRTKPTLNFWVFPLQMFLALQFIF